MLNCFGSKTKRSSQTQRRIHPLKAITHRDALKLLNIDEFIRCHLNPNVREGQRFFIKYKAAEVMALLVLVRPELEAEPTLARVSAPINIIGDIHGQFIDLLRILSLSAISNLENGSEILMLGDYVDRGPHSLEVICLLFALRLKYGKKVTLLRGNHECRNINFSYGFLEEMTIRFPGQANGLVLWREFNDIFSHMSLAALVNDCILCMHGGISPHLKSLDDITQIKRPLLDVPVGLAQDLLWADPDTTGETTSFAPNRIRGISHQFGVEAINNLCKLLNIDMIVRAHQVVQDGYEMFANRKCVTIFSAPKYCNEFDNSGAVLHINSNLRCSLTLIRPLPSKRNTRPVPSADELLSMVIAKQPSSSAKSSESSQQD